MPIGNIIPGTDTGQTSADKLNQAIAIVNKIDAGADLRTGTTLLFDHPIGAFYNADSPSNSSTVTLSPTGRVAGYVCAFYNDGSVEPTISPTPNPAAGTWVSGQVNIYWFTWDGTNFTQNIQTAPALPQLTTPTFTLAAGATALTLDYSAVVTDANSTAGTMEISSDQATWYAVTAPEYTFGDTSGTINAIDGNALIGGTTYYVRLKTSASGYQDSDYATENATASANPQLTTPVINVQSGITQNTINRTSEDGNSTGGVMEFSTDGGSNWNPVPGFTFGTNPTVHTGLTNGTTYQYRYKSTAAGYQDSDYATGSGTPSANLLFDDYTGGFLSYGVINSRAAYTGSAFTIRRSSDEAEFELGFDSNGVVDYTDSTFVSWLGSNDGRVYRFYDSSIQANHLIHNSGTFADMALMFTAGSPNLKNGVPSIDMTASILQYSFVTPFTEFNYGNSYTELSVSAADANPGDFPDSGDIGRKGTGARISLTRDVTAGKVGSIYSNGSNYLQLTNTNELGAGVVVLQSQRINNTNAVTRANGVDGQSITNLASYTNTRFDLTVKTPLDFQQYVAFSADKTSDIVGIETKIQERLTTG